MPSECTITCLLPWYSDDYKSKEIEQAWERALHKPAFLLFRKGVSAEVIEINRTSYSSAFFLYHYPV